MRFSAIIPVLFGLAAFVLSMLCLFAGSKQGFMEEYAIVTLNTSRIGQNVFNATESTDTGNFITNLFKNVTNTIEAELNEDIGSFAHRLGLHDFYSAHILDYCEGYYTPAAVPNATVSKSDIHKNITHCSNRTSFFHFNPTNTLQTELNTSGVDINLSDLNWPEDIDNGIRALRVAQKAAFILYCIAAGLLLVASLAALISLFFSGRLSAFANILISGLGFLAILIASAITTAVAVKVANVINDKGEKIGISAGKGSKFLVLTWVATALAFLSVVYWMFECVVGRKRSKNRNSDYYHERK